MLKMPWTRKKLEKLVLLPDEMRERGEFLLRNPRLGKKVFGKTESGKKFMSNCYGTTVFLEGGGAISNCKQLSQHDPFYSGDFPSFYWENESRPGMVEVNLMQKNLKENYYHIENPIPGDIVVIKRNYMKDYWLTHTGIWTGIDNLILSQFNFGGKFFLEKLSKNNIYQEDGYFVRANHQTS